MVTDKNGLEIKPGSKVYVPAPDPRKQYQGSAYPGTVMSILYDEHDAPIHAWVDLPEWENQARGNSEWLYGLDEMVVAE